MADRIPLIVNSTASQIQEVPDGDVVSLPNNALKFGTGLNISYTDAVPHGSKITHSGTDDLRLQISGNQFIVEKTTGDNFILSDFTTGEVRLYHAGNGVKLTTKSTGVDIAGDVDHNGSMDISTTLTLSSTATASTRFVVSATTASTSKTTGCATFAGGVGISGALNVGGDITAFASSDVTLKENITPISNAVDKVRSISGNTFTWNKKSVYNGEEGTGIIAQEIEALGLPGVTETREDGTKAVRYDRLVPLLIEAIKELDTKVKSLEG